MELLPLFFLALIQGATEFLPVSSSAHLILTPALAGFAAQSLLVDVAVHVGTLGAVLLYYRQDTALLMRGCLDLGRGNSRSHGARMVLLLSLATLPLVLIGFAVHETGLIDKVRTPHVIAMAMILFAIPLQLADSFARALETKRGWTVKTSLVMGFAQVLALIPGASRSGVTMTAARGLGYGREEAARLSMLMSIPAILASGILLGIEAASQADGQLYEAALAALLSFFVAYAAIGFMLKILTRSGMFPFVIYRIAFGALLLLTL